MVVSTFMSIIPPGTLKETRTRFVSVFRFVLELLRNMTLAPYWSRTEEGRFVLDLNSFSIMSVFQRSPFIVSIA